MLVGGNWNAAHIAGLGVIQLNRSIFHPKLYVRSCASYEYLPFVADNAPLKAGSAGERSSSSDVNIYHGTRGECPMDSNFIIRVLYDSRLNNLSIVDNVDDRKVVLKQAGE